MLPDARSDRFSQAAVRAVDRVRFAARHVRREPANVLVEPAMDALFHARTLFDSALDGERLAERVLARSYASDRNCASVHVTASVRSLSPRTAMTLLASLVATSKLVAATSARLAKVKALVEVLRSLDPEELEVGVLFLSGEIRQGRIGIGYATLKASVEQAALEPA